jgi:hypothetical protein
MFGDEMIDEASHKMALAIVARGRASGLGRDGSAQDDGGQGSSGQNSGGRDGSGRDGSGPGKA